MNNAILPQPIGAGVGVVTRARMPHVCNVCGAGTPYSIDYTAREVANAIAYKCYKCAAIEYVSATAPTIVA